INKYLLLLLIFVFGFSLNEHHGEIIVIDWHPSEESHNVFGYTFEEAGYDWENIQPVPVFVRSFFLNSANERYIYNIDNPVYEAIEVYNDQFQIHLLPHQSEL